MALRAVPRCPVESGRLGGSRTLVESDLSNCHRMSGVVSGLRLRQPIWTLRSCWCPGPRRGEEVSRFLITETGHVEAAEDVVAMKTLGRRSKDRDDVIAIIAATRPALKYKRALC